MLGLVLDAKSPDDRSSIAVSGLERGILAADFCHPRIAALNQRREEWRDRVRVPVIFWIPEYFLRPLARGAPDFLDWRVGTFLFVAEKPAVEQTRVFRADLDVWRHTNDERAERIAELRTLIARFSSGPHGDDLAEARRLLELALEAAIKMRLPEVGTIQELLNRIAAGQQAADAEPDQDMA